MNKAYVFVVCGAAEHIETLNTAIAYLELRTKYPIYVLTDQSRNEIAISCNLVVDVQTPVHYTHHQAAIYLKTGVHKFLPSGTRYVYLDTDILAIGAHIDSVFDAYVSPIIFAPDHCSMQEFSAYAVNCSCLETWQSDWNSYHAAFAALDLNKTLELSPALAQQQKTLQAAFVALQTRPLSRFINALRYLFSAQQFYFQKEFVFDKKQRVWKNKFGEILLYETPNKAIAKASGLRYNSLFRTWKTAYGKPLWEAKCEHLGAAIQRKFALPDLASNWQHWNGGFFIFDDGSKPFLDRWHEWSIAIFLDPEFKTRDQGTLIATVWSMGLQAHPTLHVKWNFLLDYHSNHIRFDADRGAFSLKGGPFFRPEFVHVYHHWNDQSWDLWRWLVSQKNPK